MSPLKIISAYFYNMGKLWYLFIKNNCMPNRDSNSDRLSGRRTADHYATTTCQRFLFSIIRRRYSSILTVPFPLSTYTVTRWLNFLSIFGHLQQYKFAQQYTSLPKQVQSFAKYQINSQKNAQDVLNFATLAKFCQIWSHC